MRACALLILLVLLLPPRATAANWFWRPNSATQGAENGRSYGSAWRKDSQIAWGDMRDGDTLFVCGRHDTGYSDRSIRTGRGNITISGDCPGDPGEIISVGIRFTPDMWQGPNADGVYRSHYSGSPSSAMDDIGQLLRLDAAPTSRSPCRSYFHASEVLHYKPCGPPRVMYPTGGGPVVGVYHDNVTVERLLIRNAGTGIEVRDARGTRLRHLRVMEHTGIGILLAGRTSDGVIEFNEIQDVTDGIYAVASGNPGSTDRHDRWRVEGNLIRDIGGSGDSHGIGWQSGSDNTFLRNSILRAAGSGITIYAWRTQENARNRIEDNSIIDVVGNGSASNQRGIELSGDKCWTSADHRAGDVIRNNIISNVTEGIYVKAVAGGKAGARARIEGNQITARRTGIRWASPNGGPPPDLPMADNRIEAPRKLEPVTGPWDLCR